jgi:hypothetical protein
VGVKAASGFKAGASAMARKMDMDHPLVVQVGLEDLLVVVCQVVVATAGTSSEKALVGTTTPENTNDPVISLPPW